MDFHALCKQLNLGALTEEPIQLTGGLMHKMYRIATESGVVAVKCLNPHVMARPTAAANFAAAEELERKLTHLSPPFIPAFTIGGRKMQQVNGRFFYLFPYFEGKALPEKDITPIHCAMVGAFLAYLHAVECHTAPIQRNVLYFNWNAFDLSEEDKAILQTAQEAANAATLPPLLTICHNDMDPKNVLWNEMDCRIIDLECLGYGSPYLELLETALCWAGYERGEVDFDRFIAFVSAYTMAGGRLDADWSAVYDANCGRLAWLHYNLQRANGSEGEEAIALGKAEVAKTLTCIRGYTEMKETIVGILEYIKKEGLE